MYFFTVLLLFAFGLRVWLSMFGGVHPDEAYYWVWSKHLALGYFDHPPMIAWMIRAGDFLVRHLFPESVRENNRVLFAQLGLRLVPSFVSSVLTPLAVARCIQVAQRKPLRMTQMVLLFTTPIFLLGPAIITPDLPFFFFWTCALWLVLEARPDSLKPGEPTPFRPWLAVTLGLVLGLMAWSKYAAILAAFLVVATGVGFANAAVAGLVALVTIAPHLLWNFRLAQLGIEGGGVLFQVKNGLGELWVKPNYVRVGDLWLSQILLWSPLLFASVVFRTFVRGRCRVPGRLAVWTFFPLLFFSATALRRSSEANWPLVGVIGGLVLSLSAQYSKPFRMFLIAVSNLALVVLTLIVLNQGTWFAQFVRPFRPDLADKLEKPSRLEDFRNWENFHASLREATRAEDAPIEVESYQLLSELYFFDEVAKPEFRYADRLRIWEGSRPSQYTVLAKLDALSSSPPSSLSAPAKEFWLLTASEETVIPDSCRLRQRIYKGLAFPKAYRIFFCR